MHSPMLKTAAMVSWIITAIASINYLLAYYDRDLLARMVMSVQGMDAAIAWIVGIAGVMSIAFFVMKVTMKCSMCGCCPCTCKEGQSNGRCPRCGTSPCTCR